MATFLDGLRTRLFGPIDKPSGGRTSPYAPRGVPGFVAYGGYLSNPEENWRVAGQQRWIMASEILANISIVAASLRYMLNLVSRPVWKAVPPNDTAEAKALAEFMDSVLYEMDTSWSRIVRRTGTYRYHGFGFHEWTAKKRDDGKIGIKAVDPRPQHTITKWDIDLKGDVAGIIQNAPQSGKEIYLPRQKLVYLVDDTFTDSPEGMGWFRQLVDPANRMKTMLQLEGIGFERDLSGIPVGRVPLGALNKLVEAGDITEVQRDAMLSAMRNFLEVKTKTHDTGIMFDSATYVNVTDNGQQTTNVPLWDLELLTGEQTSLDKLAEAIRRTAFDMAAIIGTEQMLVGREGAGSLALSEDKSRNLYLNANSILADMTEAFDRDIVGTVWTMNGFPDDLRPYLDHEDVAFKDAEQIARTLRDMATAGAILAPDDPAINDIRDLMGIPNAPEMDIETLGAIRAAGAPVKEPAKGEEDDGDLPTEDEKTGGEAKKAAPRPLYVRRDLLNAPQLIAWAKAQGFKTTMPADEMHVTIVYSKSPVDWIKMGQDYRDQDGKGGFTVAPGGPRVVEQLGDKGAVVLLFASDDLKWRNMQMMDAGASSDYPEYQPHVTITYDGEGVDLASVTPYLGPLRFGPEIFEPIEENWHEGVTEKHKRYNPSQPRVPGGSPDGGKWTDGAGPSSDELGYVPPEQNLGLTMEEGQQLYDLMLRAAQSKLPDRMSDEGREHWRHAMDDMSDWFTGSKKKFNASQPRAPAGTATGGQWTDGDLPPEASVGTIEGGLRKLDKETKQRELIKPNEGKTIEQMRAEALINQDALRKLGTEIDVDVDGADFSEPPKGFEVKTLDSLTRKIADEGYSGPHEITDISRATFVVDSPEDADKVLHRLSERGAVYDKGWSRLRESGYLDRKVYLSHPNNGVSEIQIVPRAVQQIKAGQGHRLYEVMRVPSTAPDARRAAARKSRTMYSRAIRDTGFVEVAGTIG